MHLLNFIRNQALILMGEDSPRAHFVVKMTLTLWAVALFWIMLAVAMIAGFI